MSSAAEWKAVAGGIGALQIAGMGRRTVVGELQGQFRRWRQKRLLAALRAELDGRAVADIGVSKVPGGHDWLIDLARQ